MQLLCWTQPVSSQLPSCTYSFLRQRKTQVRLLLLLQVERSRKEGEFSVQLATRLRESNKAAQVGAPQSAAASCQRMLASCSSTAARNAYHSQNIGLNLGLYKAVILQLLLWHPECCSRLKYLQCYPTWLTFKTGCMAGYSQLWCANSRFDCLHGCPVFVLPARSAQVVAEVHVAEGVGRVEAALRAKLGQIQLQTHSLQDAVALVKTELGKLSRAQQRLSTLHTHLQDKLVVNRGRQQVRKNVLTAERIRTGQDQVLIRHS